VPSQLPNPDVRGSIDKLQPGGLGVSALKPPSATMGWVKVMAIKPLPGTPVAARGGVTLCTLGASPVEKATEKACRMAMPRTSRALDPIVSR
jgi:hypothetical protein